MYTPHPDRNAIGPTMPEDLIDAVRHRHEISYEGLREMREVVASLADLLVSTKLDLVPFFATGGIPYVFPVLHILSSRRKRALTSGSCFHMFPGLAWGGKLQGKTTLAFFVEEFGRLLNALLATNKAVSVLEIDTTNTGNSTKRFVRAIYELCVRHSIMRPTDLTVRVVAIVNRARAADGTHDEGTHPVLTGNGDVPVLIPEGFRAIGPLVDRQPMMFVREDGIDRFHLTVSYWIVGDIPTEDKADLLGVHAQHDILGVHGGVTPGRLVIRFSNDLSTEDTGDNTPGHRLINLLAAPLSSQPWPTYEQYANTPPLTPEQKQFVAETRVWSEAPLRLMELDSGSPEKVALAMLALNRLLDCAEIYQLSRLEGIPDELVPPLAAKLRASLRADPAANPGIQNVRADEAIPPSADSIEPHETLAPEAVGFFRRIKPELVLLEPDGDWPVKARWWFERTKKQ